MKVVIAMTISMQLKYTLEPSLFEDSGDAAEIKKGIAILSDKVVGHRTAYCLRKLHLKK